MEVISMGLARRFSDGIFFPENQQQKNGLHHQHVITSSNVMLF